LRLRLLLLLLVGLRACFAACALGFSRQLSLRVAGSRVLTPINGDDA